MELRKLKNLNLEKMVMFYLMKMRWQRSRRPNNKRRPRKKPMLL